MTITGTPIDNLQFSDGNDPIATGDDLIRAALLLIDGRLNTPLDLKHSVRTDDHGLWVAADGRNNIVRANVHPDFVAEMVALNYLGFDGAHIGVPDYRGRVLVGLGQHADVNELTDNDGMIVANRRPKHKHTVTDPGHKHEAPGGNQFMLWRSGDAANWPGGSALPYPEITNPDTTTKTTGVSVGPAGAGHDPATDPLDGPAYGVGTIFIFTGKP